MSNQINQHINCEMNFQNLNKNLSVQLFIVVKKIPTVHVILQIIPQTMSITF